MDFFLHTLDPLHAYGSTWPAASSLHNFVLAPGSNWPNHSVCWIQLFMKENLIDQGWVVFTIAYSAASQISLSVKTPWAGRIPQPNL